jgi:hypothetical protein
MDQNKPLMPDPGMEGPKPGMEDTRTGSPIGPQTDVGESSAGPTFDLDSMFDDGGGDDMGGFGGESAPQEESGGFGGESAPQEEAGEEDLDVPDSNAGAPGPDAGYNEEEENPTMKALRALARYV